MQEILDHGLHAIALSRYAGVWVRHEDDPGGGGVVGVGQRRSGPAGDIPLPEDFQMPPGGLHIRWPDAPLEQERG